MIKSYNIGNYKVTRILEASSPMGGANFLFPKIDRNTLEKSKKIISPRHYVPEMDCFVITFQMWVVHVESNIIVIDAGVGNFKNRAGERSNMLNNPVSLWLEAAGAPPEKVTHVLLTHLHGDHVGWCTSLVDNRWEPTFPNARYFMPKIEFENYQSNIDRGIEFAYQEAFVDSVKPVAEAGLVEFVGQETRDIEDMVRVEHVPGHSLGMLNFRVESGGQAGVFSADILHNPYQIIDPTQNTVFCEDPEQAMRTRYSFLEGIADSNCLFMPAHFGAPYSGYVRRQGDGYTFVPVDWE